MNRIIETLGVTGIAFFAVFVVVSLLEVIFALLLKEKLRKIFKPLCLTFLIITTIILLPDHYFLYIGLIFGLGGDIFLIFTNKKIFFPIGTALFFINHVFIFLELVVTINSKLGITIPYWSYLIVLFTVILIIFIPLFFISRRILNDVAFSILGVSYFTILSFLLGVMIIYTIYIPLFMFISLMGYILFIGSDTILTIGMFIKRIKYHHFYVMSTYLMAQFLIVFGIALTYFTNVNF